MRLSTRSLSILYLDSMTSEFERKKHNKNNIYIYIYIYILLKQLRTEMTRPTSDLPLKSAFNDEREMESSLFPITDMIPWIFWELSLASKENPLACPIAVSIEAHKFILTSL